MLIPFLEIIFSIFNCNELKKIFDEINCFQGVYIAHTLFAFLGTILVLFFSFVFGKFYFDVKTLSKNQKNRESSNYDFSQLVIKIMIVVLFEVTDLINSYNVIISLILVITSSFLYFRILIEKPFFFLKTQKVFYF